MGGFVFVMRVELNHHTKPPSVTTVVQMVVVN